MEWRNSENAQAEKPEAVEFDYISGTVYVRKDFTKREGDEENQRPEHWSYREIKVPVSDWEIFRQLMEHSDEIGETQEAAVELAGDVADGSTQIEELQAAVAELGIMLGGE